MVTKYRFLHSKIIYLLLVIGVSNTMAQETDFELS